MIQAIGASRRSKGIYYMTRSLYMTLYNVYHGGNNVINVIIT